MERGSAMSEWLIPMLYSSLLVSVSNGKPSPRPYHVEPEGPAEEGTCGTFRGNITTEGLVYSPHYPAHYPNSLTCDLTIWIRPHQMARLYFIDFALEESRECWLDRLEVWEERLLLGGYCGRRPPPLLLSNKTYVKLVFMSDRYISSRGFVALLEYISIYK